MDIRIIIGGQAGQGIDFAADTLSKAFIKEGYYVFNYRYYQSLIKGGHNYNAIRVSDEKINSHEEKNIDFIIALDQNTVNIHKNKLKEDGYIIADKKIISDRKIEVPASEIIKEVGGKPLDENIVLIIALWKILGFNKDSIINVLKEKLGEIVEKYAEKIYNTNLNVIKNLKSLEKNPRYYLSGSEGVALGAIAAGLDIYLAYPMTPASPVLHILASLKDKYNILVYQPDNEIGVINIALGASYAGAKVMIGSSGGGIDLMAEAISFSGISEIPIVIYWAQRYGPGTGMATHTSQADLLTALHIGHGEFPRFVIAPGDPADAFYRTIEAFYFAYKYRIPAIILSDLFLAESKSTFDQIEYPDVPVDRFIDLNPLENYKNYPLVDTEVRRAIPGFKAIVKSSSYEHDEFGLETEDPEIGQKMSEKRLRKIERIYEESKMFRPYEIYGKGNKLIVSWGSNKMPILDLINYTKEWKYLHIYQLYPFLTDIRDILEDAKKVVLVENNLTGQLGKIIMKEIGFYIEDKILKHNGEPFTASELYEKVKYI